LEKETIIGPAFFASQCECEGWHRDVRSNIEMELKQLEEET
jgi:hypothetical protein